MTGDVSHAVGERGRNGSGPDPRREDRSPREVAPLELCRLTVLARSVSVDLALPTDVPVSLLVPGIVELLGSRIDGPANGVQSRPWVLSRVGSPPLAGTSTLNEASVHDGDLLVLGTADAPAPAPLYDDLMHAVATTGTANSALWTMRTAQNVGFGVSAAAVAIACLALLRPLFDAGSGASSSVDGGTAAAVAAVLLVTAGAIVGRFSPDARTSVFLSGCALPLMFTSGILFVPGKLGASHVLLGAAAAGAIAILALRLSGLGTALFTGCAAASMILIGASLVSVLTELAPTSIGAGTTVVALAGLALAPRISMMQAHLPLPPVPTAGAPLDEEDEGDDHSPDDLDRMSSRARNYLTGIVCASTAAAAVGATLAALGSGTAAEISRPGLALAILTALVLVLRGRTFAEVAHAVFLVAGGSAVALVLLGAAVHAASSSQILAFAVALAIALVALTFGSLIPIRTYSPVLRRAAELVEYAAIAAILPLACWVCGLYAAMRAL